MDGGDDVNDWQGPPHNADMSTQSVQINSDMTCAGDWVSFHSFSFIYFLFSFFSGFNVKGYMATF